MKIISVISITIVGLLAAVSVTAYGQMGMTAATNDQNAEALVDTNGNLRVPDDYRTVYQSLGSWAVAADKGQVRRKSMSFMHRQARLLRIVNMGISATARCW
jgi:hypothetical protein